jgi:Cdc6-like AAA superfamily ATPase
MVTRAAGGHLLGRQHERDVLDRVLASARDGEGSVLAVHGEPGVGKTALLDYALSPKAPRPACHAGGRGFESRRSR